MPLLTAVFIFLSTLDIGSQPIYMSSYSSCNYGLFRYNLGYSIFGYWGNCGIFGYGGGYGILGYRGGCRLLGGYVSTNCLLIIPGCSNPGCVLGYPGSVIGESEGEGEGDELTSSKCCIHFLSLECLV